MRFVVLLVASNLALAQELSPPPLISAPGEHPSEGPAREEPRRAEAKLHEPIAPTRSADSGRRIGRVVSELLLGSVAELGGTAIGALVGCALDASSSSSFGCLGGSALGGLLGMQVGIAVGVWGVGRLWDGDGNFGAVLGGQFVGTIVGFFWMLAAAERVGGWAVLPFAVLPLLGAVVGFEATSNESPREATVSPALGVDARGRLSVGLQGTW